MDEVDGLIVSAVKNLGCEFQATRLKEFSTENVFEAIARCILHIQPNAGLSSVRMPPNTGSRFRVGTQIANIIKELGYKEDIGYQTILYGSESEVRRLMIFLIEKLPKESESTNKEDEESAFDLLLHSCGKTLRQQINAPWVPWFCRRLNYKWDGRYWSPASIGSLNVQSFLSKPLKLKSRISLADQVGEQSSLLASVIANNSRMRINLTDQTETDYSLKEALQRKSTLAVKPKLAPKPKPRITKPQVIPENEEIVKTSEQKQIAVDENVIKEKEETTSLNADIESLEFEINEMQEHATKLNESSHQMHLNAEKCISGRQGIEDEMKTRKRFVDLLSNASDNISKLKEHVACSESRMNNLTSTWENHKQSLIQELNVLRASRGDKTEFEILTDEIKEMNEKLELFADENTSKKAYVQQLKAEYDRMEKTVNRAFYTKRILEIVANVRKQKEEIDKILLDIKSLQKDINMMNGKLDRTFVAVDELIFNDAKKDDLIRRAYKIVVSLHESCSDIVSNVESTGRHLRDIRDIEDKIELEAQNVVDKKLEQLVNNYCEVKQENETLEPKIEKLSEKTV